MSGTPFLHQSKRAVSRAQRPRPPPAPPSLAVFPPNYLQNPSTGRAGKALPTGPAEPVSRTSSSSLCSAPRESHPAGAPPIGWLAETGVFQSQSLPDIGRGLRLPGNLLLLVRAVGGGASIGWKIVIDVMGGLSQLAAGGPCHARLWKYAERCGRRAWWAARGPESGRWPHPWVLREDGDLRSPDSLVPREEGQRNLDFRVPGASEWLDPEGGGNWKP